MNRVRCSFVLVSFAALAAPALAQDPIDSTTLARVVVTATRLETAHGSRIAATTVLDGASLRAGGVTTLLDALRLVPGTSLVRGGGLGAQSSLFIRGGESDYVRVLVDGAPVNDPGGSLDLAAFTLDNVDRIEVVRGPVSVLYGSDAVSGVVQVFTRHALPGQSVQAGASQGRYGTREATVSATSGGARHSLTMGVARHATAGMLPFNNQYRDDVLSLRVALVPSEGSRVAVSARQQRDRLHYPTDAAGAVVDHNAMRADRRSVLALDVQQPLGARATAVVTASALEGRGMSDDQPDDAADTLGFTSYWSVGSLRRRTLDARVNVLPVAGVAATLGAEWTREAQRNVDQSNFDAGPNRFAEGRANRALYAQVIRDRGSVSVSAGGRIDDNGTFGTFRTARLGLAWQVAGATLRATVGTGFKAPTLFEQFNTAFSTGNPDLRPERSRSVEAGVTKAVAGGRASVAATWFDQRFRDMVQFAYLDRTQVNYFNVAAASARGLELEGRSRISSVLSVSASLTLLRTRVDDAGLQSGREATFVLGQRLLRRPAQVAGVQLVATPTSRLRFDGSALFTGRRDDRDFSSFPATPREMPPYVRLDLGIERRFGATAAGGRSYALMLRGENLTGARYEEIVNYRAPGRSLTVGVRADWRR